MTDITKLPDQAFAKAIVETTADTINQVGYVGPVDTINFVLTSLEAQGKISPDQHHSASEKAVRAVMEARQDRGAGLGDKPDGGAEGLKESFMAVSMLTASLLRPTPESKEIRGSRTPWAVLPEDIARGDFAVNRNSAVMQECVKLASQVTGEPTAIPVASLPPVKARGPLP